MRRFQESARRQRRQPLRSIVGIALIVALAAGPVAERARAADAVSGTVPEWLRPQTRLRLTPSPPVAARPIVGEFREARGDSIWIRERFARFDVGIPLSGVARFEVSRERSPKTWTGAGLGFLAGALIGGAVGANEGADQGDTGARIVLSGLVIGSLGMILGAIVGHTAQSDHWNVIWSREADPR